MLAMVADGRLAAERWGTGAVSVLALHGWGRSRLDWTPSLSVFDALAPDLPGFGLTPEPDAPWHSDDYAALLRPLLSDEPMVVVGHSFGGRVAVRLAAACPEQVSGLVLTGVPLARKAGASRPALSYRVARTLHRRGLLSETRLEALRRKHGSPDYRNATPVMRGTLVNLLAESYQADIASLTCPVALVWGEHDTEVPVEIAERARPWFATATLSVVPGAGHLLSPEFDAPLQEAVRSMLRGHS